MYEKFAEIWSVVFDICEQKDKQTVKQTYIHADHNTSHLYLG